MENIQYYSNTCECGCGELIEIKRWHKWRGHPKYIIGHYKGNLNKKRNKVQKFKMSEAQKLRLDKLLSKYNGE